MLLRQIRVQPMSYALCTSLNSVLHSSLRRCCLVCYSWCFCGFTSYDYCLGGREMMSVAHRWLDVLDSCVSMSATWPGQSASLSSRSRWTSLMCPLHGRFPIMVHPRSFKLVIRAISYSFISIRAMLIYSLSKYTNRYLAFRLVLFSSAHCGLSSIVESG